MLCGIKIKLKNNFPKAYNILKNFKIFFYKFLFGKPIFFFKAIIRILIFEILKPSIILFIKIASIPILFILAYIARYKSKKIDIGLGPEPLINNIYHKKALQKNGYSCETFVCYTWFITQEFDYIFKDRIKWNFLKESNKFLFLLLFIRSLFRYNCLYIYFNGGSLQFSSKFYLKIEPLLYKIAKTKIVVMPYGADILDASQSNLILKHFFSKDYPIFFKSQRSRRRIREQIDLWTENADHIISGCDWVDYLHHWDTLTLAHFSIDTEVWKPSINKPKEINSKPLRILHAPNHRWIKGTKFFIKAIEDLKNEGFNIELKIFEKQHNSIIKQQIEEADIVADQLVLGWYAMFALESMALQKPVLCYLRDDFLDLYEKAGLIEKNEIPLINCNMDNVKEKLREIIKNKETIPQIGQKSREFVIKHHSLDVVGKRFSEINRSIGVFPKEK